VKGAIRFFIIVGKKRGQNTLLMREGGEKLHNNFLGEKRNDRTLQNGPGGVKKRGGPFREMYVENIYGRKSKNHTFDCREERGTREKIDNFA